MNADRVLLGAILVVLIFIGLKLNAIERQMPSGMPDTVRNDIDAIQQDVRALTKKMTVTEADKPNCWDKENGKAIQSCLDLYYSSQRR